MNTEKVNFLAKEINEKRFGPVILWTFFGLLVLMILAAIATPNLLRSRIAADEAARWGPMRQIAKSADEASAKSVQELRKIVRTATMDLEVTDVPKAAARIAEVTRALGGYVEQSSVLGAGSASLALRVPADRFDDARVSLAALARHVNHEEVKAADVTAQYVDYESQLRNFRAEEAQYLEIMRRSGTIKETVTVAERLADVRGRIERMQGQLNVLSHQVEMAVIAVSLTPEVTPTQRVLRWHPVQQVRESFLDGAQAMANYANTMIALALYLPAVLAWCATIGFGIVVGWRVVRWTWRRWFTAAPVQA